MTNLHEEVLLVVGAPVVDHMEVGGVQVTNLHEEVLLVVGTPVVDHMEVGGFAASRAAVLNEGRHGVLSCGEQ